MTLADHTIADADADADADRLRCSARRSAPAQSMQEAIYVAVMCSRLWTASIGFRRCRGLVTRADAVRTLASGG
jgi:hypothetical protein